MRTKVLTLAVLASLLLCGCGGRDETSSAPAKEESAASQAVTEKPEEVTSAEDGISIEEIVPGIGIRANDDGTVSEYLSTALYQETADELIAIQNDQPGVISCRVAGKDDSGTEVLETVYNEEGFAHKQDFIYGSCRDNTDWSFTANTFNAVTGVSYNDDFTDFYLTVSDKDKFYTAGEYGDAVFESDDELGCVSLLESNAQMYHVYKMDYDSVTLTMHFVDADGNEFLTETFDEFRQKNADKLDAMNSDG